MFTHDWSMLCVSQCASEPEPSFLPSAAQFGSSKHSHMTFTINPSTVKRRSVSMVTGFVKDSGCKKSSSHAVCVFQCFPEVVPS